MSAKMEFRREVRDDYTNSNIPYGGVTSTRVLSTLRSPKDFLQMAFNDDVYEGFVGESYKSLSLEENGSVCFSGFTRNLADSFTETKPSTSVEFHGLHTYNTRANTDAYYTIYNDPYGVLTEGGETDKKPTVQLTGFVREQYNRKMILLGNNINRATIDGEFAPEWYITKRFDGSSPFTNTPLVPKNEKLEDHTSFLIMDRLGQKFYMNEEQWTLSESKGYRVNVYKDTDLLYEGAYAWGTHEPSILDDEITDPAEEGKIILDIPDKTISIEIDGTDDVATDGSVSITVGTTTLVISASGDIDISGSGDLNITTTGDVVFNSGTHAVVADGDITSYGVGNSLGKLTTMAGSINYAVGLVGMVPIVPAPATVIDSSYPIAVKLENGDIQTAKQGTRKEMVE